MRLQIERATRRPREPDPTETENLLNRRRWLILAVVGAAFFMTILDVAIVNVAIPSIEQDLHIRLARTFAKP